MTFLLTARAQSVRVFSYGGGVQSNAVLALQAMGKLRNPYDYFVFANVGEDSENPATLEYIQQHAKPFAAKHGIEFVELRKMTHGKLDSVVGALKRQQRSILIPARMAHNGAAGNRNCTQTFKIEVVDRWIRGGGWTYGTVGIGISLDEWSRMRSQDWHNAVGKKKLGYWKRREHPLLDMRLRRSDCHNILLDAGLPVAPKSSCFFCPFKRPSEWTEMKREEPKLFQKAVELERLVIERRAKLGKDPMYFHSSCVPLDQAVGDQLLLFPEWEMDVCESGYCMV